MTMNKQIKQMPKIELHVHLEGSVQPSTLLKLATKNNVELPSGNIDDLLSWYTFSNFDHFSDVYLKISECIKTVEDIELIAREFLQGQFEQNIVYTEITYTAYTHCIQKKISFDDQLVALNKARKWAEDELGIYCNFIIDIPRQVTTDEGLITAKWLTTSGSDSIVALGLGGPEYGHPPQKHKASFDLIKETGYSSVPHAGETEGPSSIWGAVNDLGAIRIGHGVRCVEDEQLMNFIKDNEIILEVCPTSNICLGVFDKLSVHCLPQLIDHGIKVTINSDDPPMFNTTLTNEYYEIHKTFGFSLDDFYTFNKTALEGTLMPAKLKSIVEDKFYSGWNAII